MKKLLIDNTISTAIILVILVYFNYFFNIDFLDPVQNTIQDFYITDFAFSKLRNYNEIKKDTNIVLVNIGRLGRRGIANQIERLNRFGPKVIGIDTYFFELKNPENDSLLSTALSKVNNLVMVSRIENFYDPSIPFDTLNYSNPYFSQYASSGFANLRNDDKTFRNIRMILTSKQVKDVNEVFFSIKIASIFNKDATHRFLDRGRDFELINYKRNYEKYITLDWDSVLSSDNDLSFIRNKIVLMGYMGTDLRTKNTEDNFFTPLNDKYVGKTLPDMYGVVIHANVISMIMEGDFLYFIPEWLTIVLTALIIFLTMCFLDLYRRRYEMWYEPASVFIIIIEAAFLFWGVVLCFHWFGLDLRLNKIIFAILIIVPVFELYQDSLKPIALSMKDRVVGLISRKVPTEEKPVEENKTSDSDTEL